MTPEARNKLRELAMAARTRYDWERAGDRVVYQTIDALVADLSDGMGQPEANAAFIAAVHPGAIIELLDEIETAEIRMMLADIYTPAETETWLTSPHPQLAGASAADAIHAGRFDEVAAIIERINAGAYL